MRETPGTRSGGLLSFGSWCFMDAQKEMVISTRWDGIYCRFTNGGIHVNMI